MTIEEMKSRRKELGYSMRELADLSGVPFGTVQKIFSGKTSSPRHETIVALEKVLKPETQPLYESVRLNRQDTDSAHQSGFSCADSAGSAAQSVLRETAPAYGSAAEKSNFFSSAVQSEKDGDGLYDEIADRRAAFWQNILSKKQGDFTVEDWENLPEDVHAELIDGVLYLMASPLMVHQELVNLIATDLTLFIRNHHGDCRVFPAPTGCRLLRDNKTMVEPDISVICDRDRITRKWMDGAPDFVIEVLSPSNRKHDLVKKLELYERAGVREYWIVDPEKKRVLVYDFADTRVLHIYTFNDKIPVGIWDGECKIDFSEISRETAYLTDDDGNY